MKNESTCILLNFRDQLYGNFVKFSFNLARVIFQHDNDPQVYNKDNRRMIVKATFVS